MGGADGKVLSGAGVKGGMAMKEKEETKAAAHKLRRAKAYAHLLTRGKKALAYADLQVSFTAAVYEPDSLDSGSRVWPLLADRGGAYCSSITFRQKYYNGKLSSFFC